VRGISTWIWSLRIHSAEQREGAREGSMPGGGGWGRVQSVPNTDDFSPWSCRIIIWTFWQSPLIPRWSSVQCVHRSVCAKNWQNCQVAAATAAWWGTARLVSWLNIGYYYPIFTLMFMMLLAVLSLQREESFSKKIKIVLYFFCAIHVHILYM
jgi:hypothetical protein